MQYFVYIIATKVKNKTISYVGYTSNLSKRLNDHNTGKGAKFTRGKKWKIIFKKQYKTKSKAMQEEYKLKKNYLLRSEIKKNILIMLKFKKIKGNLIHPTAIINWDELIIGKGNIIGPYVVIGNKAQWKNKKNSGKIKIGNKNIFFEYTNIHLPTTLKK